jgi:hypothetical protein
VRPSGFPNSGAKVQSSTQTLSPHPTQSGGLRVGLNRRELKFQALILGQNGDGHPG